MQTTELDPYLLISLSVAYFFQQNYRSRNLRINKSCVILSLFCLFIHFRYLWNEHLLKQFQGKVHHDWVLNIIHGFVDQANVSVLGSPVLLTLIARRSSRFAGTRFLKRGANYKGDVANEVETEQIVADSSLSNLEKANITSFVQIRGSVPGQWSQDTVPMVPKPQIYFQASDPTCQIAGKKLPFFS